MRNMSERSFPAKLRVILREKPDGVAVPTLCEMLQAKNDKTVYAALHRMPDAYIDRWETVMRDGRVAAYRQVWCVVPVPENCPRPGK